MIPHRVQVVIVNLFELPYNYKLWFPGSSHEDKRVLLKNVFDVSFYPPYGQNRDILKLFFGCT